MAWETIKGAWRELGGSIRTRWGKLSDSDLAQVGGDRTKFVTTLQSRYGIPREEIERQVADFETTMVADARSTRGQPQKQPAVKG